MVTGLAPRGTVVEWNFRLYEHLRWHDSPFDQIEGPGSQDAL
jgi:hypothetical protein